jgi:hypothetical protein
LVTDSKFKPDFSILQKYQSQLIHGLMPQLSFAG